MTTSSSNLVDIGRLGAAFGVKGWIKVQSFTEPSDNILSYNPWWLKTKHGVKEAEVLAVKPHGAGYVAHLKGIDDRDQTEAFRNVMIAVERSQLEELDAGEYYWHQLQGMRVYSEFEGQRYDFGVLEKLLETGANDVLVVKGDAQSLDESERLVPYVPDEFVLDINIDEGTITVCWDPEF